MSRRTVVILAAMIACAGRPQNDPSVTSRYESPRRVTIIGYASDAMEPFISRDGRYLLFNNLNDPSVNTDLHFAERVDDTTFRYRGKLSGVNTTALEGVPTMDSSGTLYFVSPRSYSSSPSTIYRGRFADGVVSDVELVPGISPRKAGIVNFDVDISRDGNTMFFVDGTFSGGGPPKAARLVMAERVGGSFRRRARTRRRPSACPAGCRRSRASWRALHSRPMSVRSTITARMAIASSSIGRRGRSFRRYSTSVHRRMSTTRIALANIRAAASPDESVALAQTAIEQAAVEKALIVCFPECYVPGYRWPGKYIPPPDAAFLERAWAAIAETARVSNIAVVLGTERIVDGAPRITVLVIDSDGTTLGFQDKVQLDPSEGDLYSPGSERHVFQVGELKFGVVICHEGWRYPETVRWAARRGAHVVFHPHYGEAEPGSHRPTTFRDPQNTFHESAMLCRAAENTCWFASVNCASEGSPTTSAVARPDGTLMTWQPYGVEGLLVADIDTAEATGFLASRCRSA